MAHASSSRGRSTQYRRRLRALTAVAAALALGALTGLGAVAVLAGTALGEANDLPSLDPDRLIDATHVPPLLTAAGERVALRYDIYCTAPDGDPESGAPCDAGGTVYVRAGPAGPFRALPLRLDPRRGRGPLRRGRAARDRRRGGRVHVLRRRPQPGGPAIAMTLPTGGADAPHRTLPLGRPVEVELGRHVFGRRAQPVGACVRGAVGRGCERGRPRGRSAVDADRARLLRRRRPRRRLAARPGEPPAAPRRARGRRGRRASRSRCAVRSRTWPWPRTARCTCSSPRRGAWRASAASHVRRPRTGAGSGRDGRADGRAGARWVPTGRSSSSTRPSSGCQLAHGRARLDRLAQARDGTAARPLRRRARRDGLAPRRRAAALRSAARARRSAAGW